MSEPKTAAQHNAGLTGELRINLTTHPVAPKKEKWVEDTELAYALELALREEIAYPCHFHPAGRNHLFLNPQERQEIINRVFKVLGQRHVI